VRFSSTEIDIRYTTDSPRFSFSQMLERQRLKDEEKRLKKLKKMKERLVDEEEDRGKHIDRVYVF